MVRTVIALPFLALLAACSPGPGPEEVPPRDPQVAQALDDPLMTDPDLSARNERAAALTVESDGSLPLLPATPEAIAAARLEAAALVGGADKLVPLGDPQATGRELKRRAGPADQLAALVGGEACRDELQVSAIWAARLPVAMPMYPRGATQSAAGSNAKGCDVRVVSFTTPVPLAEVMAFYAVRARSLGTGPLFLRAGEDLQLRGSGDGLVYDVRARSEGDHTFVRLTTLAR
ncbi:hypothetical protein A6F68_02755 [Tsuneonella dongtanensis]|uniref:Lipoprotein n=1 Tax=Tsuneonella dongtanensis TaxID=692370 RepID=A0A1B2AGT1_9SPHN|nr:hypothetical protein [Tsuneonella dongtanensis]ANY21245.1 hypothetical protein A6F68_02755 [Tsuneonella dongtanensis]